MMVKLTTGNHTEYPDSCPFHATKANKLGVCGHRKYGAVGTSLICDYLNIPSEHHNPSSRCPLISDPIEGITVQMSH